MYLSHLWHAGGIWEFDQSDGSVVSASDVKREDTEKGCVWKQGRKWYALWTDDTSWIFQSGNKKWHLTSDINLKCTRTPLFRKFTILRNGKVEYRVRYWFKGTFMPITDPTYDFIDETTDDFFLIVKETWSYWKDRDISELQDT